MTVKNRLKEPSTYAGLSAIALLFGVNLDLGTYNLVADAIAGIFAVASVVIKEIGRD